MNHIIERAAKAAFEAMRERAATEEIALDPWESEPEGLREDWRKSTMAAVAALREPTEAMWEAVQEMGPSTPEERWQAMIDAALSTQETDMREVG